MRLRRRDGIARAVYVTAIGRRVVILRVFTKKTQKTPRREDRVGTAACHSLGNNVPGIATVNPGDADHRTFKRMGVAAGNRLKTVHDLRRGNDRNQHAAQMA
jgi:hypothetical protein